MQYCISVSYTHLDVYKRQVINNGGTGSWAFGTPAKTTINTAGSGVNSFVTGGLLTGFYNDTDISYVQGPCFDFTNICDPVISLKVWWNAEFSWDGMNVTYSTDGGTIWNLVGAFGDPNNWYTDNTIVGAPGGSQSGWSGSCLLYTSRCVQETGYKFRKTPICCLYTFCISPTFDKAYEQIQVYTN